MSPSGVREITALVLRPPAIDIADRAVETLGVLMFQGPGGEELARRLARQLASRGGYRIVGPDVMRQRLMRAGLSVDWEPSESSLRWVHERAGVDAVVLGQVDLFRVEGGAEARETITLRGTGDFEFVRNEQGKLAYRERMAYAAIPLYCRSDRGRVGASYRIWDARRGEEVATVRHEIAEEMASFCYREDVPERATRQAQDRLLQKLFGTLNDHFVEDIAPRAERSRISLAVLPGGSRGALAQKNELAILFASRGEWNQAIELWRECLAERPGLAPIHFNLAVAYRAVGRRTLARKHATEAVAQDPRALHRRFLEDL